MKFTIPIVPTGQIRARHGVAHGFSRTYKDEKQRGREETIKAFLAMHRPERPLRGPLLLGVQIFLPIPKSKPAWFAGKPKDFQAMAREGRVRPIVKPDLDNAIKQIKDCLSQMRFWEDDRLVVGYLPHMGKYYSEEPRWEVEIVEWCINKNLNV